MFELAAFIKSRRADQAVQARPARVNLLGWVPTCNARHERCFVVEVGTNSLAVQPGAGPGIWTWDFDASLTHSKDASLSVRALILGLWVCPKGG